ncbi:hypothetical protein [Phaeobacter sp. HF9A]|uniref:hypothetical protein n=1 Tax=Phaeobacter sp. HF9A TaxID=2721561 RepID=UPI001431B8F0|nr:hypothetical protein [Phaeobacter sp. HF9A]NIZ13011.1 hypothetical protein [Phaeobacter sp. HF9A]
MDNDSNIEQEIIARLRQAITDAEKRGYERGVQDTMEKIQSLVMTSGMGGSSSPPPNALAIDNDTQSDGFGGPVDSSQERQRAPKGLARKVIQRALNENPGLTPAEIEETAQDDLEKMIRASSYRNELRKGREAGLYEESDGKWFLVDKEKAEEAGQASPPPLA